MCLVVQSLDGVDNTSSLNGRCNIGLGIVAHPGNEFRHLGVGVSRKRIRTLVVFKFLECLCWKRETIHLCTCQGNGCIRVIICTFGYSQVFEVHEVFACRGKGKFHGLHALAQRITNWHRHLFSVTFCHVFGDGDVLVYFICSCLGVGDGDIHDSS